MHPGDTAPLSDIYEGAAKKRKEKEREGKERKRKGQDRTGKERSVVPAEKSHQPGRVLQASIADVRQAASAASAASAART